VRENEEGTRGGWAQSEWGEEKKGKLKMYEYEVLFWEKFSKADGEVLSQSYQSMESCVSRMWFCSTLCCSVIGSSLWESLPGQCRDRCPQVAIWGSSNYTTCSQRSEKSIFMVASKENYKTYTHKSM
jgi:hypothetical protein